MDDKSLMEKVAKNLQEVCKLNKLKKVNKLSLVVDSNSKIDKDNLYSYLRNSSSDLVGEWTDIQVEKESLGDQVAILHNIKGE